MFSVESPHRGDSNEYTQYTIFNMKKKTNFYYPRSAAMGFFLFFFRGTQKRVRNSHGQFEPLVNERSKKNMIQIYLKLS